MDLKPIKKEKQSLIFRENLYPRNSFSRLNQLQIRKKESPE